MAGTLPNGAGQKFIDGIKRAQTIGLPAEEEIRPTFHFPDTRTYANVDSDGKPWDAHNPGPLIGAPPKTPVQAICGKVVVATSDDETALGRFKPIHLKLTFMPDQWDLVHDFVTVDYDGLTYNRAEMEPVAALGEVTIRRVHVRTPDAA